MLIFFAAFDTQGLWFDGKAACGSFYQETFNSTEHRPSALHPRLLGLDQCKYLSDLVWESVGVLKEMIAKPWNLAIRRFYYESYLTNREMHLYLWPMTSNHPSHNHIDDLLHRKPGLLRNEKSRDALLLSTSMYLVSVILIWNKHRNLFGVLNYCDL